MKLTKESVSLVISLYKRRLFKNIITSTSIFAFLFFGLRILDYTHSHNYKFIILEVAISLLVPLSEILDIIWNSRQRTILNKFNHLENTINSVAKESNEFLGRYLTQRLTREIEIASSLINGQLRIKSLQNYEFIREIFVKILTNIMKPGDFYITLSSLGFWCKRPFLEINEGRKGFIKINVEQSNYEKNIKRIIVIDKRLLLPDEEINALPNLTDEIKLSIQADKSDLKSLILDFNSSEFKNHDRYNNRIMTLFYCVDESILNHKKQFLATGIIASSNFKNFFFIQTKDLTSIPNNNAQINFEYRTYDEKLAAKFASTTDVKQILFNLNQLRNQLKSTKNDSGNNSLIDINDFIQNYLEVFEMVHCHNNGSYKVTNEIKTIAEMTKVLFT